MIASSDKATHSNIKQPLAMWYLLICSIFIVATASAKTRYEVCANKETDKLYCWIEYAVRDRWEHSKRYVYDLATNKCFLIRWAKHCDLPPPSSNNFISQKDCEQECSNITVWKDECAKKGDKLYCWIEYASRNRWPHTNRYVYDVATKKCFLIRWANHCDPPPPFTNNFATQQECERRCCGLY